MSAKRDYAASISTKGLDGTGLTEDVARKLYSRRGRGVMAIVELIVDETSDKRDGSHKVQLAIATLELALDDTTFDEHIRELSKTLHFNRAIDADQPTLDGGDGINPKVSDVIRDGVRHRPHPFLPVNAADDNGICDVCGLIDSAGVHSTQDFLPDGDEEEGEGELDDTDPAAQGDEPEDNWTYPEPEPHQAGDEPTVAEVLAAKERATVPDPFRPTVV